MEDLLSKTKSKCIDCNKEICYTAKRCKSCANRNRTGKEHYNEGKNNPRYINGKCLKSYTCKQCHNNITLFSALYGQNRCGSCEIKRRNRLGIVNKIGYWKDKKRPNFSGKNHPNWNNGSSFEPYPIEWTKTYREQIRKRDNHKCQLCGVPEVECTRKLHVHHMDYDKENLNENNLISLCPSCHIKTNYNRNYWIEYFKEYFYGIII